MLEFREISIADKEWINNLLKTSNFMGCEYSFANNLAWRRLSDTKITRYKDFYISCNYSDGKRYFTFPAGKGDYKELFKELQAYSESLGSKLTLCCVNNEMLNMLNEIYPDKFESESEETNYDYIYLSEDLINLSGKKYHNKRNHLKKLDIYDWHFEEINDKNMDECIAFSTHFYNSKDAFDDHSNVVEQFAINTFFNHFNELGLKGGILKINGQIEGFSIGEQLNSDTLCVHIEKANSEITGAYVAINNEFVKHFSDGLKYVNREEDLGIEGLRKAKKSYYPCFLLKKHTVKFKEGIKL